MNLTDTFIIENAELLIEQRGGKTIRRLRGTFGRCDEKNNNNRVYSKHILQREVTRIAEAMSDRRLLGELDHPSHDAVKLSNVSHLITGLDFKGNELIGECELLDTPAGKVAQALIEGGVKVGISSRGMGTLSDHTDGTRHVNEDFKLVTFDLVADPSTRGAFPGISESALVEEIVKDTLEKAAQEKVFTTMLKDKLREKMDGEGTQSAEWTKATVKELQKKANKKMEKPTVEEPFKNWNYFYGKNFGLPKFTKTRSYNDAETVTAPAKVSESKYCILKDIIVEDSSNPLFGILLTLLRESIVSTKPYTKAKSPGILKKLIGGLAQKAGDTLSGKADKLGGAAGKLLKQRTGWKRGGMAAMHKANLRKQFDKRNPPKAADPEAAASDETPARIAVSKKKPTISTTKPKRGDEPVVGATINVARSVKDKITKAQDKEETSVKEPTKKPKKAKKKTQPQMSPTQMAARRRAEDEEWSERPYARR